MNCCVWKWGEEKVSHPRAERPAFILAERSHRWYAIVKDGLNTYHSAELSRLSC